MGPKRIPYLYIYIYPKDPFVCPKKWDYPYNPILGMGFLDHQSYVKSGGKPGFLGLGLLHHNGKNHNIQKNTKKLLSLPLCMGNMWSSYDLLGERSCMTKQQKSPQFYVGSWLICCCCCCWIWLMVCHIKICWSVTRICHTKNTRRIWIGWVFLRGYPYPQRYGRGSAGNKKPKSLFQDLSLTCMQTSNKNQGGKFP